MNQTINVYSNEMVAKIRKYIKAKSPTLSVKKGRGTAGAWIDVDGSLEFGRFTEAEKDAAIELGLVRFRDFGNHIGISPEERKYLIAKWGLA